jgi:hypothetical protein
MTPNKQYLDLIEALVPVVNEKYGTNLTPNIIKAVIKQESGWNVNAKSPVGAMGLMQLMPDTANQLNPNADPTDPLDNIAMGITHLAIQTKLHNNDVAEALASYNYGEGNIAKLKQKYGDNYFAYLPDEPKNYVSNILSDVMSSGNTTNTDSGAFPYPTPEENSLIPQSQTPSPETYVKNNNDLMLGLQYGFAAQGAATDKQAKAEGADVKSGMYKLGRNLAKATKFGAEVFTPVGGEIALTKLGLKVAGPLAKAATQAAKGLPLGRILSRAATGAASAGASNLAVNTTGSLFAPKYNEENTKNNLKQAAFTAGAGAVLNPIFGFGVDANTKKVGVENTLGKLKAYAQTAGKSVEELVKGGDQEVINIFKSIADDYSQLVKPFDDVIKSGVDTKKLSKEAYKELVDQVSNATKPIIDNMKAAGRQVIADQTKKVKLPEKLIEALKEIQRKAVLTKNANKGTRKVAEQLDFIINNSRINEKSKLIQKMAPDSAFVDYKVVKPEVTEANAEAIVNSIKEIQSLMGELPDAKKYADMLGRYADDITDLVPSLRSAKEVDKVYSDVLKGFGIDPTDIELATITKAVKKSIADPSYSPSADKLVSLMDNPKLRITTKGTPLEGKISILNPEIQAQRVKEAQAAKELVQHQFGKGKPGATTMFKLLDNYTQFKTIPETNKISKAFLDSDVGSLIGNSVKNQKVTPQQVEKAYLYSFAKNAKAVPGLTKQAEAKFANEKSFADARDILSGKTSMTNLSAEEAAATAQNLPNNPISGAMNFFKGKQNVPVATSSESLYPSPRDIVKQAVDAKDAINNAVGGNFTNTPALNAAVTERLAPSSLDSSISSANNLLNKQDIATMIEQGKGGAFANASDAPINVTNTENLLRNAALFNSIRPAAAPIVHGLPGTVSTFSDLLRPLYKGNATINERR